jgi:hypothetical protein
MKVNWCDHRERGLVSLLILLVIVFISWKGTTVFYKVSSLERMTRYEAQMMKAAFSADSGLEWAKASLKKDPAWEGGSKGFGGGLIVVEVERRDKGIRILASAQIGETCQNRYGEYVAEEDGSLTLIRYGEFYDE